MAEEWLVILDHPVDREALEAHGRITWESTLVPDLISMEVAADHVAALRETDGVKRLEPPKIGSPAFGV